MIQISLIQFLIAVNLLQAAFITFIFFRSKLLAKQMLLIMESIREMERLRKELK